MSSAIEAFKAFKMATRFKPDEPVERQILAELYESTASSSETPRSLATGAFLLSRCVASTCRAGP